LGLKKNYKTKTIDFKVEADFIKSQSLKKRLGFYVGVFDETIE
jgi:hypothetical protein